MPNTDINGDRIVILSEAEARQIYEYLRGPCPLTALEQLLADKIAHDLGLPPLERPWNLVCEKPRKGEHHETRP